MTFEFVVRPFQERIVTPPVRVDTTPAQTSNAVLAIGLNGSGKLFNGIETASQTFYHDREEKEQKREVSTKRVTNPNDENQYIDVELIDKLEVKGGKGLKFEKVITKYENK